MIDGVAKWCCLFGRFTGVLPGRGRWLKVIDEVSKQSKEQAESVITV